MMFVMGGLLKFVSELLVWCVGTLILFCGGKICLSKHVADLKMCGFEDVFFPDTVLICASTLVC